ncbi:MAG: hypothetical protein E7623_06680 [Ruminococcaceae bacterium]|nr:hypothetical protein [Oscillospiraceae bacterium]
MKGFKKVILILVLLCVVAVSLPKKEIFALTGYTLYVNDDPWYTETMYNWQKINQVYYVPINVFMKIDGVEISSNRELETTTISHGSKFISIETYEKRFAYTEEYGEFYFKTYMLKSGILYVPMKTVCQYFGFEYEIYGDNEAIRICDGSQKLSFYEILLIHNPSMVLSESEGAIYDPINRNSNIAYFFFEGAVNENTIEILRYLSENQGKATFFIDVGSMKKYPDIVRKIIVQGHSVGISPSVEIKNTDEFAEYVDEANEMLYKISKTKTRLVKLSETCLFEVVQEDIENLNKKGYSLWGLNFSSEDDQRNTTAEKVVQGVVEKMLDYKSFTVGFHNNETSAKAVNTIFRYIESNTDYKLLSINSATECPFYKDGSGE